MDEIRQILAFWQICFLVSRLLKTRDTELKFKEA